MPAKVFDYGHKATTTTVGGSSSADLQNQGNFMPIKTFDYGHSSNATAATNNFGMTQNFNRFNNKNNYKNNNSNKQAPNTNSGGQQAATFNRNQKQSNNSQTSRFNNDPGFNNLEQISDNEEMQDEFVDTGSPPPPPPPMIMSNATFVPTAQQMQTSNTSLFPSTAEANENIPTINSEHVQMSFPTEENQNTIVIDEIILEPGRQTRPRKICIIIRGPPGSGKSHVAKLIKDKEIEMGGANPRVLSIDDYFLIENDYEEKCPKTGKKILKKEILYEYDEGMEETYLNCLLKSFKKTINDNLYDFIIVDCNNNSLRTLNEFYCHSKDFGFVPYIVDLLCDVETCMDRNIHQRTEADIQAVIDTWKPTPFHYIKLNVSSLLENVVEMEDAEDMVMDKDFNNEAADMSSDNQVINNDEDNGNNEQNQEKCNEQQEEQVENEDSNDGDEETDAASCGFLKSKWESDNTTENLARLDGTSKPMHKRNTMEDFLQSDEWTPTKSRADGKKQVRWADIEEKRAQDKMRAIGFVVGQTDWKRMMDPNAGNRALNRTKYIERANKRRF